MLRYAVLFLCCLGEAFAHPGERGLVLLLPTGMYMFGGAAAVALSFAVMALLPSPAFSRLTRPRSSDRAIHREGLMPSAITLVLLALLVYAGLAGSRDPLLNPLPMTVWTLWWVGFTFLVVLFGDLWLHLNPWRAAYRLTGLRRPLLSYPAGLGYWPAVVLFFGFAWFELVYPAPLDPERLAAAILVYAGLTWVGMALFGEAAWLERGEAFSVFFRTVGRLSPLRGGLLQAGPLPASGVAFVLLMLATVSFDGLSRTFFWIDLVGANPLEHPGRSALVFENTLGLLATFVLFGAFYAAAVRFGGQREYGWYIAAIVPIAFGYHFAHYLPSFLVEVQYAAIALSDPFERGWNLLGARDLHPSASFLAHHSTVHAMWNVQVAGIVLAHVAAVAVAHALALRRHASARAALLSQVPMTLLMIGYTVFGLWLLSTPVAA